MSAKPIILLIHGSWHQPAHWQVQRDALHAVGYTTRCPLLPSFRARPQIGLKEDAAHLQMELDSLLSEDDSPDIIVVGHSFGGIVATEAILPKHTKASRTLTGMKGGVIKLVYMCAFLMVPGQSLADAVGGGALPPFIPSDPRGMCTMDNPDARFYHDLSLEDQQKYVALLGPSPTITQLTANTNAAYLYTPSAYIFAKDDRGMPYPVQRWMMENVKLLGAEVDEYECNASGWFVCVPDAGHSPYISQPQVLVDVLNKIVKGAASDLSKEYATQQQALGQIFKTLMGAPNGN